MKYPRCCKCVYTVLLAFVLVTMGAMLYGCREGQTAAPTDITVPGRYELTMYASLVNEQGAVQEKLELPVTLTVMEQEGRYTYSMDFRYNDLDHFANGVLPSGDSGAPYHCGSGYTSDSGGSHQYGFYLALDAEKQCFIMDMDDGKDVYLMASTSSNAKAADLWAHFQSFLEAVPEQFPTIG